MLTSTTTHYLLCRILHPLQSLSSPMARAMTRAIPFSLKPTFSKPRFLTFSPAHFRANPSLQSPPISGLLWVGNEFSNGGGWRALRGPRMSVYCGGVGGSGVGFGGGERGYRRVRRKGLKSKKKAKELELSVKILIEEGLPNDPEILSISEMLRLNAPMAMKLAFDGLNNSDYKTRDTTIDDVAGYETIELSLLLCNDEFIRKLNKDWRDEDHATDVLSMSQHIPELKLPILMLGDIVISVETAARQAEERGHTLLDEIRILLVHGLLHLLGFDHELSEEAEAEMEKEEELLLKNLGWEGKGLIKSACDAESSSLQVKDSDDRKKEGSLRFYRPKFKYIFCDMDGTLLNSKSQISSANANAVREAMSRGVQVIIATGKARPGAIDTLKTVDLVGRDGIISNHRQVFSYRDCLFMEYKAVKFLDGIWIQTFAGRSSPTLGNTKSLLLHSRGDRCLTLFDHPLVDKLHSVYNEPKAETMPSVDQLLAAAEVQKLVFLDTAEKVETVIRPYWSEAAGNHASVVQAIPYMLEIVPHGNSKGNGVKCLLQHLGVSESEIMAIGDGENDIEMLKLANLGIALSNGSEKTKAVADVIGLSNDEHGVADAIYRYAF